MSKDEENAQKLAEVMNDHQVTDKEGDILEEGVSIEAPAASEAEVEAEPSEEETASGENPPEETEVDTQTTDDSDEPEHAEDDSGKRYIPERRFKSVYGRMKEAERKLAESSAANPRRDEVFEPQKATSKADALEVELMKDKYPQFDPYSDQYSEVIDQMGADILVANPQLTRLEAARAALKRSKALTKVNATVKSEAKAVKVSQSDSGVTSRPIRKSERTVDVNDMTEAEMEAYMKDHGQW